MQTLLRRALFVLQTNHVTFFSNGPATGASFATPTVPQDGRRPRAHNQFCERRRPGGV